MGISVMSTATNVTPHNTHDFSIYTHTHTRALNLGNILGGHYVAFAKNSLRNSWFEYNDTRIHPVSADTVLSAEGYVLFYK